VTMSETKKRCDLTWLRFSVSHHRFPNSSELLHGDSSSKLNKNVVSLDFMDRRCNCNESNYINGGCPHGGDCRKCMTVHGVKCKIASKKCIGQTQQQKKKRMQQHDNATKRMFGDGKSYDSCSKHFFKQFDHEPSPKQLRKITEHEAIWQGNPISIVKTFGTLHCTLCMKERCEITKAKLEKNNQIVNSCNEIHGACRHKPRFHRFINEGSSADEPLEGKRVNMPSGKKKGKKRFSTD